jgi:MSHA pilin protein MshA
MKKQSAGFTLIELVVVIVVLGILAAFAIPRFIALDGQARIAAVNGLAGSVRSSAALAHGMWMASNSPATVPMEGQTITISNGYPDLTTLPNTLNDYTGFTTSTTATTITFAKTGAPTPATCSVTYTAATVAVPASVAAATGGC